MMPASLAAPLFVWLINVSVDLARYLLVAGPAFVVVWIWGRERWQNRLIQGAFPKAEKLWHDLRWSMSTVLVFSVVGVGIYYAGRAGVLRRYEDIAERGWLWFAFTLVLLIVLQDTYFYWTHRALHHRRLYRAVHRVHHRSTNPSPWTAYAFSPAEALVHAAFVPLVWLVVPMHEAAVFIFLAFMIARNVLGHLSVELYGPGFARGRFSGWHTTSTHHALHHQYFTSNYGLYFTFWDRLMGTTDRRYQATFERVASGVASSGRLAAYGER
jgi:sterol desaturase/sphingolipid hydroxylase (fatty acid hydroxylase superfamily)